MHFKLILIALFVLDPSAAVRADEPPLPPPRDAANASFWTRLDTVGSDPQSPPISWYQPLATLVGKPGRFLPVAPAQDRAFARQTIDEATSFADATNGDALLVARCDARTNGLL